MLSKLSKLGAGLEVSEETLDKAAELIDEYRDQLEVEEDHLPPASLHIASRINDEPRTQKMILSELLADRHILNQRTAQYTEKDLRRQVKRTVKKLREHIDAELSFVRSHEHLPYLVSQIDEIEENDEVVELAEEYCRTIQRQGGLSRSKVAIAGACLEAAVEETDVDYTLTHTQLAEITGMNRTTFENNLAAVQETILD